MKNQHLYFALFAIAAIVLFSGCMTPITVQTEPPGATVYCRGWGRPSYKWKVRGKTETDKPVTFRVPYNTIHTVAIWPGADGKPAVRRLDHCPCQSHALFKGQKKHLAGLADGEDAGHGRGR